MMANLSHLTINYVLRRYITMDNITFNLIQEMILDLEDNYDLCHSNGTYTHIVNRYTYIVERIDLENNVRIISTLDDSMKYLEFTGDPRQDKYGFINRMRDYIRSSAVNTPNHTSEMSSYHVDDALKAAAEGRVYHWNGGQLYTKEGSAVKVYDFTTNKITWMTLAKSWVYMQENRLHKVDIDSVRYAARSVRNW
jgi:uncharacterized protein YutD